MKQYFFINNLGLRNYPVRRIVTFLFIFLGFISTSQSQKLDEWSNPQVVVLITHPPGLGLKINKVAFNIATGNCADQIVDALISDFVSNNVDVIDRANLKSILAEHDFNFTGYVDQTTAVAIGKIIGPSALITVKVLRCETKTQNDLYVIEKKYDYSTGREYQVKAFIARTSVFLKVSLQTTDLTTGRIFSARVFDFAPVQENKSYEGRPEAPSEFDVQEEAFNSFAKQAHRLFFSWIEPTTLYFCDDKDGDLKEAYLSLKSGNYHMAYNQSLQNLENCKNNKNVKEKTLAHAYYNLGIMHMIRNEYDKAIENFNQARKLRPGTIVNNAINECVAAKDLANEMQKVDEKAIIEAAKSQNEIEKAIQADEANTLTNADIIDLTNKKLPNSLILQKIKTTKCKFDTSTDALIALTNAGVSEDVIIFMMEKSK